MTDSTRIRLVLADDHAVLRAGLRLLLDAEPDLRVVGEATNGAEALAVVASTTPDVLILDLTMPGLGGLSVMRDVRAMSATTRVLVLSMHDEPDYVREALRLGAMGYVLKSAVDQELLAAIRAVARGDVYIYSALTRALLDDLITPTAAASADPWTELSEREQQVIRLVALGHTNREIAEQLHLSVKTVETYRARAMEKLGLGSRAELVEYAAHRGLLSPD